MAESDKLSHRPWQNIAMANITRELPLDLSSGDFTDENGFFIRSGSGGVIKYCPVGNVDAEAITKTVIASAYFNDPVICRKVFKLVTSPDTEIYIGYGV
jgi:hypothetical protein